MKFTGINVLLKTVWFLIWLTTSLASALSVQGEDESSKLSNVFAEDLGASSLTEMQLQRHKNRELRLLFLGALTEQLVKWFFNDVIPSEVMHRTKRSLNIPGKNFPVLNL